MTTFTIKGGTGQDVAKVTVSHDGMTIEHTEPFGTARLVLDPKQAIALVRWLNDVIPTAPQDFVGEVGPILRALYEEQHRP